MLKLKERSETDVNNLVKAIENIISFADNIGLLLAKHIDSAWKVPPNNLSNSELINYYNRLHRQDAIGEQVIFQNIKNSLINLIIGE